MIKNEIRSHYDYSNEIRAHWNPIDFATPINILSIFVSIVSVYLPIIQFHE